jgi:hypothetical protein
VVLSGSAILLQACTDPAFYFRGYNSDSTCSRIIDTELALGAEFVDAYESRDVQRPGYVTELAGTLFDEPVRIEVRCGRGNHAESVNYIALEQEPEAVGALYAKFVGELEAQFGASLERLGETNRSRYYFCANPAPVFIEEWALVEELEEGEEEEAREHELYVAVVPDAAVCIGGD